MDASQVIQIANDFANQIIKETFLILWSWMIEYWPFVLCFALIIIGGVIFQIRMMKTGGHQNRLPPGFNRLVGSLTYLFFFWLQFTIAYLIFGSQVLDDLWFLIFGGVAFPVTKLFLVWIGFWYY